ncbi:MAG: alpha/beta hydrolase [Nocardioidaceae bacterium]
MDEPRRRPHPQAQVLLDELQGHPLPGQPGYDLERSRADVRRYAPPRTEAEVAYVADVTAGGVPCRLYRPAPGTPVVVHLHGGGFVEGGLESHDAVCHALAARSGWSVLAVDYRLAPEHPYPAALEDAEAVLDALDDVSGDLNVDPARVALLGDSGGGTFAAALTLREREVRGDEPSRFALQVLVYPGLEAGGGAVAGELGEAYALTDDAMDYYLDAYVPAFSDRSKADVAPARARSLHDLPPALVLTAELDPLCEQAEEYASRLADDGVPVVATRYLGMVHGFWRRPATIDASRAAVEQAAAALRSC